VNFPNNASSRESCSSSDRVGLTVGFGTVAAANPIWLNEQLGRPRLAFADLVNW
jgi:hypothetical protein